jgi:hypothetical protein
VLSELTTNDQPSVKLPVFEKIVSGVVVTAIVAAGAGCRAATAAVRSASAQAFKAPGGIKQRGRRVRRYSICTRSAAGAGARMVCGARQKSIYDV